MKSKENDRKSKKTHSSKGLLYYAVLCSRVGGTPRISR